MAKTKSRKTGKVVTDAAGGSTRLSTDRAATAAEHDIARRAYELYLAGGCAHGRDVEDWLQAEQELT